MKDGSVLKSGVVVTKGCSASLLGWEIKDLFLKVEFWRAGVGSNRGYRLRLSGLG